jgi:hypothetical protein
MVYKRILKLPCDDVRSGIGFKSTLDAGLRQLMTVLFKPADGFKVDLRDDTGGHFHAIVTRGSHKIDIEARYGQNRVLAEGKQASFVSYTVHAEAELGTGGRSETASENAEVIGRIVGVMLAVGLVTAFLGWIFASVGRFVLMVPVVAGLVYAGRKLGGKVGRAVARHFQAGSGNGAAPGKDVTQAKAAWERLTNALNTVTGDYPTA